MAGHSKWANIQHRKGAQDKKRAKIFSKVAKAIMTATREGGPDPEQNLRLKYAVEKAKQVNMPRDNIARAIKSASGAAGGDDYEEILYEGYGPGGVAIMIEALTDNRNRTAPELRKIFEKGGGNLGSSGCVAHSCSRKAFFTVEKSAIDEDAIMELVLESGADDVQEEDDLWEITGGPESFSDIKKGLEGASLETRNAEVTQIANVTVKVEDTAKARRILNLMEALDDHEDVQNVHANFDIPPDVVESVLED
jgi:YebC/PmpR family DNA-binding regulatory protein